MLLHQFHDILPGSSIAWVHREARATYQDLEQRLRGLADRAVELLADDDQPTAAARLAPRGDGTWQHRAVAETAVGARSASTTTTSSPLVLTEGTTHTLDNGRLRAVIDEYGHVISLRDLGSDRELVPAGQKLGALRAVPRPAGALGRVGRGPARARSVRRFRFDPPCRLGPRRSSGRVRRGGQDRRRAGHGRAHSRRASFCVEYRLQPDAAALEIVVDVDWHEREHLLKIALPLDIHTRTARYETQYGVVERSVTSNTSWDEAQYEVSQHRFVHLEEPGCGIGVVNDSSYGLDVRAIAGGTVVRPSLLRGARFPDPGSDLGRHRMAYAVVAGDLPATIDAAYEVNAPVLELPEIEPLLELDLTGHRCR